MGCIIACGIKLSLSTEVIPVLKTATKLSFQNINTIKDRLTSVASYAMTVTPAQAYSALEGLLTNSSELIQQFTLRIGLRSECLVNVYHLMCGIYIYSKLNVETKANRIY